MSAPEVFPINLAPAIPIVQGQFSYWQGIAASAFNAAQTLVHNISLPPVQWVNMDIPFNLTSAPNSYTAPSPPASFDMAQADPGAVDAPPSLPQFVPTALTDIPPPPPQNFSFSPGTYSDWLLDQTKQTLASMQNGNFVLPQAAADALRNRAFEAASREEMRGTDQVYSDFAARGFDEPPGLLNLRLIEVRDTAREVRMGANRDVYIQDQQIAQENFRLGVSGSIQLEGILTQLFTTQEQMQLEAAKFGLQMALQVFEADVRRLVALQELTAAEAQVYTAQVQAIVSLYHTKIEKYQADTQRIETKKDVFVANTGLYGAEAQVALAASQADQRSFELLLERERARVQTAIQEAEQNFQQVQYWTNLLDGIQKTLAEVQSQLASAAMNAVHVGASLGYSGSESVNWSTNVGGSLD